MRAILGLGLAAMMASCSPSQPAPTQTTTAQTSAAGGSPVAADAPAEFQAASGNIGCQYVPAGGTETYRTPDGGPQLICDRIEPAYVRFTLSARGAATLINHVGDASCCGGDVMSQGGHWTGGPFTCDISEAGVACANADHRGFTLSRTEARAN